MRRDARETLLKLQTEMIYGALTSAIRLPDPVLGEMFGRFRAIARLLSDRDDGEMDQLLEELEAYFKESSPLSGAIRKILTDARPSQMKSVIRGYLVNYVYEW